MQTPPQRKKSKLQSERERRGWSRSYVAQQVGVSEYTVGQWERGKHMPYPVYVQKLCELFETRAEALDLINSSECCLDDAEKQSSPIPVPHTRKRRFLLAIAGMLLVLIITSGLGVYVVRPFSLFRVKPGGVWISPTGTMVGDVIHFAAYAYPTNNGDPQIDHVNFTAYWPGVDPRMWKILCVIRGPARKDVYACDVNIKPLGAPRGPIIISFDVYDRQGNYSLAPNGEHRVMYVPDH
ncbi:MAG TPA: helix-turn-helix transcriptional regulator [Ktedonobacteraceae bacterium]|nr:helix-turn-helix transcriptional regulator [Ktedonobacteraceae bacterium]